MENSRASPNNNSLTALPLMETTDAMEVSWTTPLNSLRTTELSPKKNTHTLEDKEPARLAQDLSRSADSLISEAATTWLSLLPADPFQLLLMPPTGQNTLQEFSITVRLPSTTESLSLESVTTHGPLRTHGETLGEKRDSSDSQEETLAVSAMLPHSPLNDCSIHNYQK